MREMLSQKFMAEARQWAAFAPTITDTDAQAIIGPGVMGRAFARNAAYRGHQVLVLSYTLASAERGVMRIRKTLEFLVRQGRISSTKYKRACGLLVASDDYEDLARYRVRDIFETGPEELKGPNGKLTNFAKVDKVFPKGGNHQPNRFLNSSSIPPEVMAAESHSPEFYCGAHAYNPFDAMALWEVIVHGGVSRETVLRSVGLAYSYGRTPVLNQISTGNVQCFSSIMASIRTLEMGGQTASEIDDTCILGLNRPMGDLRLADKVGLDITQAIPQNFREFYGLPGFEPSPLLDQMVADGHLGVKTKRGFHVYTDKDVARLDQ